MNFYHRGHGGVTEDTAESPRTRRSHRGHGGVTEDKETRPRLYSESFLGLLCRRCAPRRALCETISMSVANPTPLSAAIDRENPWPGLASFTEDARTFFFGRKQETDE